MSPIINELWKCIENKWRLVFDHIILDMSPKEFQTYNKIVMIQIFYNLKLVQTVKYSLKNDYVFFENYVLLLGDIHTTHANVTFVWAILGVIFRKYGMVFSFSATSNIFNCEIFLFHLRMSFVQNFPSFTRNFTWTIYSLTH